MRLLILVNLTVLTVCPVYSQYDAAITSAIQPIGGGCELGSEIVGVVIANTETASSAIIPSGSIEVNYSLNDGPVVQQTLGTNLGPGATWNFNFTQNGDFSSCQAHDLVVWINLSGDPNPNNDTLSWIVQNDCIIQPGEVSSDLLVCEAANQDTLTLVNSLHGYLDHWISSTDNGTTWQNTGQSDTNFVFTNLIDETIFAMAFDGGFCDADTSDFARVELQPVPDGGNISGDTTLCEDNADGSLELNNVVNNVVHWESSTDFGANWDTIANTTTSKSYSDLEETTWYRASIDGGVCPDVYSSFGIITIDTLSEGGELFQDSSVCLGAEVDLFLDGFGGDIQRWEFSIDGGNSWDTVPNLDQTYTTTPLIEETSFRVMVQNGVCAEDTSNTILLELLPESDAGFLFDDTQICPEEEADLTLENFDGDIIVWEYSFDEGASWDTLDHTDSEYNTGELEESLSFRVIVQNGVCDEDTSNTVTVEVSPLPVVFAGVDETIFEGDTILLNGIGGTTGIWTPGNSLSDSTSAEPLAFPMETTEYVYTVISDEGCINSDTMTVFVEPPLPISVKNVITSNNDGYNDFWIIEGIDDIENVRVSVFNIYGTEVYQDNNYQNNWDGTYQGSKLPDGTYMYIVEIEGKDEIKGTVTILGNE